MPVAVVAVLFLLRFLLRWTKLGLLPSSGQCWTVVTTGSRTSGDSMAWALGHVKICLEIEAPAQESTAHSLLSFCFLSSRTCSYDKDTTDHSVCIIPRNRMSSGSKESDVNCHESDCYI
ncbi:hypothetical protein U9M48_041227 [Paspalum notatum var. saurae]|uniref:Secreted protein n=1 Tax=Paspalum notatum var. saurae TaxID=547442 RepID=A0AAQ3XD45_PASNO